MTERTYKVTVLDVPKSVNAGGGGSRRHHMAAHTDKKMWEQIFGTALMVHGVRRGMSYAEVDVALNWKRRARRDTPNWFQPVIKPFADAMVRGGWLPDDSDDYFKVAGFSSVYPEAWPTEARNVLGFMVIEISAVYP